MIALLLACCLSAAPDVTVDTSTLTMGSLVSFPSGDLRAAIRLGNAPQPGAARRFMKQELLAKVTAAGGNTADLQIPDSVLVHRKSQPLDAAAVKAAVQAAFVRQYPDAHVNVVSVDVPSTTQVPTGDLEISATVPGRADLAAPVFVKVEVAAPDFSRTVFVRTTAEVARLQPVLRVPISANARIGKNDVEWKLGSVLPGNQVPASIDRLDAFVAKRDLLAGEVLMEEMLYAPLLVKKGEAVTVTATNGGITISATMRARTSAKLGDTVVVEHLSGAGTTTARVTGPGTLEALKGIK